MVTNTKTILKLGSPHFVVNCVYKKNTQSGVKGLKIEKWPYIRIFLWNYRVCMKVTIPESVLVSIDLGK